MAMGTLEALVVILTGPCIALLLPNCSVSCKVNMVAHPTTQVSLSCGARFFPDVHPLAGDDHAKDSWNS